MQTKSVKSAFIRARIEPHLKESVEQVFKKLGMSTTQVITMLYKYVEREHSIPIELSVPNKETAQAIQEARAGKGLVVCEDADDMFAKLKISDADTGL